MVKVKEHSPLTQDGEIHLDAWLTGLAASRPYTEISLLRDCCQLAELSGAPDPAAGLNTYRHGLGMAEILTDLGVDSATLAAAILYPTVLHHELTLEDIREQITPEVVKLIAGVERMEALQSLQSQTGAKNPKQVDNLRKMLIAMLDDVRIVVIKLAERLHVMRNASSLPEALRQTVAQTVMQWYAPLANRLGIGQLKWELEDLAFRYLQPSDYQAIAKGLNAKRVAREQFVGQIVASLKAALADIGLSHARVFGRAKHIYSIHKKMQRKNVALADIVDATAVRVLVDSIPECYRVLALVHDHWQSIRDEFDDYISQPKANGYRSLHTAVIGPAGRIFEVQIRTHGMHQEAELGVAAHWRYKEGVAISQLSSYEAKIAWLRDVMSWQAAVLDQSDWSQREQQQLLNDRVYVFTPKGDIIDLPQGSTPVDFAYHIHTEIGHRCRGAKINDLLVPLTYTLQTGDRVAILTSHQARPSRDWLNAQQGYLHTAKAKAKVLHWFKQENYEDHVRQGRELLAKELKRWQTAEPDYSALASHMHCKKVDDLFAGLGTGDIKLAQVLQRLSSHQTETSKPQLLAKPVTRTDYRDVDIAGVGDLLTYMAKCCKPVPGDDIIGYVTQGRGVSIHRRDCPNVLHTLSQASERLLPVSWTQRLASHYAVDIEIIARFGAQVLNDITSVLSTAKIAVTQLTSHSDEKQYCTCIKASINVADAHVLSHCLEKLRMIPFVISVKRL